MANNYNRFIKFDSYDLHSSSFEVVVLNMASIDSVVLNGATTKGMRFDVVFSANRKEPYYVPVELEIIKKLELLGDRIYEIQKLKWRRCSMD